MGNNACCGDKKTTGKFSYINGDYYNGDLIKGIPNGKGVLYNKAGEVKYGGSFVNGKKEGFGKYYFNGDFYVNEDGKKFPFIKGDYYIGEFLNDKMHGKGSICLKDGTLKYDGDFVENEFTGFGKYYFEGGGYYIGQVFKDKQHGKGKMYDKNNNLIFEGNYVNDKKEGIGKYYLKDGNYLITQFKNNQMYGISKLYSKNGVLLKEYDCIYEQNNNMGQKSGYIDYLGGFMNTNDIL